MPAAILLEAVYGALWLAPDFRAHLSWFFALFLSAALLALVFARSAGPRSALVCGLLFRATLLGRAPDLSDDLYRYAWDGRVAGASISPYAATPDDPGLAFLRDGDWQRIGHRDARTVYPPAAQVLFKVAAVAGDPKLVLKLMFAAFDLGVVWLLLRWPAGRFAAALYAAFPLAVFESAGMGHLDSAGVALLVAALLLLEQGHNLRSGAALALATLVKYVPIFAFLPFLRRGRCLLLVSFALTGGALWWAGCRGGFSPAAGLGNFAARWEGNSVVYPVFERAVELSRLPERAKARYAAWKAARPQKPWMERPWRYFYAAFFARAFLGGLLVAGLAVIAARQSDPLAAVAASMELLLLLSPVFHPWYALWMLPLAALFRRASWLYLSTAIALAYALLYPVAFFSRPVVLAFEYVPFAVLRWREGGWRRGEAR